MEIIRHMINWEVFIRENYKNPELEQSQSAWGPLTPASS